MVNNADYLRKLAFRGLEKRGLSQKEKYVNRLNEELDIIIRCGLQDFILITSYLCVLLKSKGIILGDGRGSVGGSLVAYCTKISEIDPLIYGLSFARFLNEARMQTSLGDIDIDIPKKNRQNILKLVNNEFGSDNTYQIINHIRYTEKTTIKDLGRIFNIPFSETNRLTSIIGDRTDLENIPDVSKFFKKYPQIKTLYPHVNKLLKNYGVHAGAVVITPTSIDNYTSIIKVNGLDAICYDKRILESNNFLKQDLLGLNNLSIIEDALQLIGLDGWNFNCDLDDPNVYETIKKSTLGIFQLEGAGATDYNKKFEPVCFEDLVAVLALVRPGAQDSGDADKVLKYRDNPNLTVKYDHPLLENILKESKGSIIYQEQAMEISKVLAGFTDVEADILRKGIGKKLDYIFEEYKPKFIQGCILNNVSEEIANLIWDKIEKSSKYSFNKSHSVGYAMLTYKTAYLKTYYPMEFYLSMLNNTDDEDKRNKIYNEMKNINKNIKNPDINISKRTIVNINDDVYLSFSLIKGVGEKAIDSIIEKQPYSSFDDFMNRKDSRKVNKRVCRALCEAGAFDCFNNNRAQIMSIIEGEKISDWSEEEKLFKEFSRLKINPAGNLLDLYDIDKEFELKTNSVKSLENIQNQKDIFVKCIITDFKNKKDYGFLAVTDNFDSTSIFVSKNHIIKYIDILSATGTPILLKVSVKNEKISLNSIIDLKNVDKKSREYQYISGELFETLKDLKDRNPHVNIGLLNDVSFFTSRKKNSCVSYDIILNKDQKLENRLTVSNFPDHMFENSFIAFYPSDEPFINIERVF